MVSYIGLSISYRVFR